MVFRLTSPPRYRIYLLRCVEDRRDDAQIPSLWRFSLENPRTGQCHAFADLQALMTYLQTDLGDGEDSARGYQAEE